MRLSRVLVGAVGVAVVLGLSGCVVEGEEPLPVPPPISVTPSVEPAPEYTPGVDADADVAAAIATYEAYVAASNELVVADRDTWDPVLELLLDDYRESSIGTYEQMAERGESFDGDARIVVAELDENFETVIRLHVCTDFSESYIRDADGEVVGDRSDYGVQSMNVVLQAEAAGPFGWKIGFFGTSEEPCSSS